MVIINYPNSPNIIIQYKANATKYEKVHDRVAYQCKLPVVHIKGATRINCDSGSQGFPMIKNPRTVSKAFIELAE